MDDSTSVPVESSTPATPPSGQATQTSQESSTTPQVQSESASAVQGTEAPKINLFEHPDFKKYQQQQSQTLTNYQRQSQMQIMQMQQQLQEAQMAGMDDLEKANFRAQQLEAQLQQRNQQDEYQGLLQQRWVKLNEIAAKTGVPIDALQNAQTPDEAYDIALGQLKQHTEILATKRAAEIKELQDHSTKVDLGSGSYTNPFEQRRADALKNKSASAYVAALLGK